MKNIALIITILFTPPAFAGHCYVAPVVKHHGYGYQKAAYIAPVKQAVAYQAPSVTVNTFVVSPEHLIKSGQTHYAYAKIGEYSGFDTNLAVSQLNRTFEQAVNAVPQVGALVSQTINQADAQKHRLYLQQSESASVVAELRELKEVVRELRAGRQSTTTAEVVPEDGVLALQASGLATCVKCHQKYADPSKLSAEDITAAVTKIYAGEMPLAADKSTPVPLSTEEAAAVIGELYGAK